MEKNKTDYSLLAELSEGSKNLAFIVKQNGSIDDIFISHSIKNLCGYTSEEVKRFPEHLYSLAVEEDLPQIKRALIEFESNPNKLTEEITFRITKKNGEIGWVRDFIFTTRENGKINSRKCTFVDITDIKKTETDCRSKSEILKDLNNQKDKFISIISHDLRSPFTTLLGFSEILLNEPDIPEEEKNEYLRYIFDASRNQLNMINCLLDWSRLQTGRIKVEPARLNVRHIISNIITPLTGDAVRKNIDVKVDVPAELSMNADERLIGQAILHLVSNAIKFTPEGKDVHITASRFKEGFVEIVVRDEGLGISEENQSKLFRIDQKFSLPGTGGEKGSGLGLTLVKEIIDKHGGQVWFYSQVGSGSEFHLTIPEAKNLILLVEDDHSIRELYKKLIEFSMSNFEVRFAENGYEAIKLYRDLLPTLIITDHDMPLMNGMQLVEILQKKESNKAVPIIVISAKLTDEISKKYLKLGVEKLIPKPVDQEDLIESIRACLY
jgi:two-component system, sensor histidine kinase and response regulator